MSDVTFRHDGGAVDYTPSSDVTAGDVIVQGQLVGVAKSDIDANVQGALAVEGVFDFPKADGSGTAISAGAKVYWDDTNDQATETAGANVYIGKVVEAATDDDTTVRVRMSQ